MPTGTLDSGENHRRIVCKSRTGEDVFGDLPMTVSARSSAEVAPFAPPAESAKAAGLRYTTDARPGIRRIRRGRAFTYVDADGKRVRAAAELARIRALVIPPAWIDVWICPDPRGHLQATGRDARGRKQYRYHPKWRVVRDETKYDRVIGFAKALPVIRRTTSGHLRRQGLPREKVLATVVQLLEKTLIRVGNDEYARSNRSYGLTTMRDGHVEVKGPRLRFSFRGKSGVEHEIDLTDRRLAKIVRQCRDLPGYELFQYVDENGARQSVGSEEVNAYLKDITGQDLTSKDFRTWAGTVLAAQLLRELEAFTSNAQAKRNILAVVDMVAKRLGNTKAVCRKCYIHPAIFDAYLDGSMLEAIEQRARKVSRAVDRLTSGEAAVLRLLKRRTAATSKHRNGN
jgi:DNA topoisomerase-1